MKIYIALLRGINVSGQKKIKMVDLKTMFENLGFTSVTTYIQSGNIIFKSDKEDIDFLGHCIKERILETFEYDVPVLVLTPKTLKSIHQNNPFSKRIMSGEIEEKRMYFTLLGSAPETTNPETCIAASSGGEEFVITKNVVYFFAANGYGKTKLNNNFFEKKLKCSATTRNLKTIIKLLEISKSNS